MSSTIAFEADILARVIRPQRATLSPALAKEILKLKFSKRDLARMAILIAKAQEGTLAADELAEAESYQRVNSLLGILKSKARLSLDHSAADE
jgi:hypothetical protein